MPPGRRMRTYRVINVITKGVFLTRISVEKGWVANKTAQNPISRMVATWATETQSVVLRARPRSGWFKKTVTEFMHRTIPRMRFVLNTNSNDSQLCCIHATRH